MKACNGRKRTPIEEGVEVTRLEPVILEVEEGDRILSHLILFEIKTRYNMAEDGLVIDGDIKETIFQMKEF